MQTAAAPVPLSMPSILIRLEGAVGFIAAVAFYIHLGGSGLLFLILILAPDLSMIGYLRGPKLGSIIYNAVHVYAVPALVMLLATLFSNVLLLEIGLIWAAHISMDRVAGYGLKYSTAFKDTHIQHV